MGLRKGNRKRENESLLIAAQNNAIRTDHIKTRIDKTQQNRRCKLCDDRDEAINHIITNAANKYRKSIRLVMMDGQGNPLGIVQEIEV